MWDDGEFRNGIDRTEDPARRLAAQTAWFENMPVEAPGGGREPPVPKAAGRPRRPVPDRDPQPAHPELDEDDPGAPRRGAPARRRAEGGLLDGWWPPTARWKPDRATPPTSRPGATSTRTRRLSVVDDYAAERDELLRFIADEGIEDVVFLGGETHVWIAHRDAVRRPLTGRRWLRLTSGSQSADPDLVRDAGGDPYAATQVREHRVRLTVLSTRTRPTNLVNFGYWSQVDRVQQTVQFPNGERLRH